MYEQQPDIDDLVDKLVNELNTRAFDKYSQFIKLERIVQNIANAKSAGKYECSFMNLKDGPGVNIGLCQRLVRYMNVLMYNDGKGKYIADFESGDDHGLGTWRIVIRWKG